MTLKEMASLNGGPFTLYGFDWDYGGTVSDWKGGLSNLSGGCNLIVVFSPDENSDEAARLKGASDNEFGSNQEEISVVSPKVARIGLAHPQR